MDPLEFGITLSQPADVAAEASAAEALGYDFVSTGEHVFFYGPNTNGLITLAAAAGATRRIKLLSSITLAPLYNAALLTKQIVTLDVVSNGRFHLGVGVGGEFAKEFEACGVPVTERGARTNEFLEIFSRLCSETDVEFEGRFNRIPGLTLAPKPLQQPHPPIWVSGRSDSAKLRAARHGTGWLPYMYTPELLAESLEQIAKLRADLGRQDPIRPGLFIFFAAHPDRERAVQMAAERLSKQYNQDFSKRVHRYAIAGNPADCVARLREYTDAGARTVILSSACPGSHIPENKRMLAEEVLPALRESA